MATFLILEPIFEADFLDCSYGFRSGGSAHDALEEIRAHLQAGYQVVYDADLKGYFDSIPHSQLLACVMGFTLALSVLSALLFAVLPAVKASMFFLGPSLASRAAGQGNRWRHVMIAVEAALSVFLLCG